jgi:hypothetical protein
MMRTTFALPECGARGDGKGVNMGAKVAVIDQFEKRKLAPLKNKKTPAITGVS